MVGVERSAEHLGPAGAGCAGSPAHRVDPAQRRWHGNPAVLSARKVREWVDPLADSQMTDISANVDQAIADVWNGDADDGWVEAAPLDAAPVDAAPTYDANGNMIDPVSGAPLAIGPDGAPIDAAAGLYFDEVEV